MKGRRFGWYESVAEVSGKDRQGFDFEEVCGRD
jgi:hypothetical protein